MPSINVEKNNSKRARGLTGFLNGIEKIGNKLPDPFMLFVYLAIAVMIISAVVSMFDITVVHPATKEKLPIKSLLSGEGLQYILTSMIMNFTSFKPLGIVLTMMLGIGLAEKVGLLETAMKKTILHVPRALISYTTIFIGILGNIASDAAFVIIPPLAAMIFYTVGRHPLAGLAAGFAGTGAGFTANFMISGADGLLSGISTEAIKTTHPNVVVTPIDNWFFMSASVIVLTFVGVFVTEKIVEPRLGKYTGNTEKKMEKITKQETDGLKVAALIGMIFWTVVLAFLLWPHSPLRNEDGKIVPSPFLDGIVPIIFLFFLTIGIVYGMKVGKIKNTRDVAKWMGEAMKDMSGYIVLIFAAAQFISFFEWSNLGIWLAVNGALFLKSIHLTGIPVIICFILLTALLNLLIFSGSAQWALEAPIFIPMFAMLDYHPAFIQVAYRLADSSTNIITPLNPYMVVILAFMREYDKKAGIGTLISLMLPYSLFFLSVWIILLLIFIFFGIPFGPGIGVYI